MPQSPDEGRAQGMLPTNKVVSFAETQEAIDAMTVDLLSAGFDDESIYVHHGEQGKKYIDADGAGRGFLGRLMRSYQRLSGAEARMMDEAESTLEAGQYLIGVQTTGSEQEQVYARDAISPHTDRPIYFCGQFTITILRP